MKLNEKQLKDKTHIVNYIDFIIEILQEVKVELEKGNFNSIKNLLEYITGSRIDKFKKEMKEYINSIQDN